MRRRLGVSIFVVACLSAGATVWLGGGASPAPTDGASATPPAHAWPQEHASGNTALFGQVPLAVAKGNPGATLVGHHPATADVGVNFAFPIRDKAALDELIQQQATSHRYLGRADLYARFAPPQAQYDALRSWLRSSGFTITHLAADRMAISAHAPTATVERALHIRINDYVRRGFTYHGIKVAPFQFYANTTAPVVPRSLGLQSISGLSDIDRFFTSYQLANGGRRAVQVRSGGYFPVDLRSLYDITGHGVDATGQTIGFTLWTTPERQAAMNAFATNTGDQLITVDPSCIASGNSPTSPSSCSTRTVGADHLLNVLENGNSDSNANFGSNVETALDIEAAHGVATHSALKYYASECSSTTPAGSGLSSAGCNGSDVGLEDAIEDAANDPTLHSVSNSWAFGGEAEWGNADPFLITADNSFALAAAAGTTFYFSTGDSGTYQSGYPSDSKYVVGVGGTSTYSTSTSATYSTTTTWSGGGSWCSNNVARPSWQTGPGVTANAPCAGRVIPDVSAVADPNTGVRFTASTNLNGGTSSGQVGGTSLAAPVLNGLQAVTQNFLNAQSYPGAKPPIGFVAPVLYQLGNGPNYSSYYRDVVCGNTANPTSGPDGDPATKGWDAATGWGEPDWFNFATGYAIQLGATGLSVPPSLAPGFAWGCARTPSNSTERGLSCPNASTCYAVGAASGATPWPAKFLPSGAWGAVNTFFKSTDGGAKWFPSNSDMLSIACTGGSCTEVGVGGRVRRTTDGGATWSDQPQVGSKPLTQISCPSASTCYAAGDRGAVYKSTDGGATFSSLQSTGSNPIYGLSCPSASTCYATDIYAHVLKTTDGGATWTWQTTPITTPGVNVPGSGGPNPFAGLLAISCSDENTCVASGLYVVPSGQTIPSTDPPIISTTDGGTTWIRQTSGAGSGNYLHGISCLAGTTTCTAVGRGGRIVTTTNLATWTTQTSGTTNMLNSVTCLSASFCMAVGQNGTVDTWNGAAWTATTGNGGGVFLASVTCLDANTCFATGKQGVTISTTNGGASWTQQAGGGTTQQMNGVSCPSASVCYAAGAAGTILKTANGGQSWLPQTSGTAIALNAISCSSDTSCAAVGAVAGGPTTLSAAAAAGSTNVKVASVTGFAAGQTFTIDTTGANPETVTVVTVGTAGATGTGITFTPALTFAHASGAPVSGPATVRFTADGSTWSAGAASGFSALNGVACTSAVCVAVGAAGTALTSSNGGATWTPRTSGTVASLNAVACAGSSCYAGGAAAGSPASGTILKSTDGGSTWTPQVSGTTQTLNGIACVNATSCFADGNGGTTVATGDGGTTWTQQGNPLSGPTSALNATLITINGAACNASRCVAGTGVQGDIITTPLLTITVNTSSVFGNAPVLSGLAPTNAAISYSPAGEAANVTGTLTCSTTADASAPTGSYPISSCSGLSDTGFNIVYDYANSSHTVVQAPQTIAFASLPDATFGDPDFTVAALASSGLPVSFAAAGNCTIAFATVHITGAGSCTVTASQAGDSNYKAAPDVPQTFAIHKADQTITFSGPADQTFGNADFGITATASSGLVVALTVTSGPCTLDSATSPANVHIAGAGACVITASQAGDDDYNAAPDEARSFSIAKASQTITFGALADKTFGDPNFPVSGSASSGLAVSFSAAGNCTVASATVHITGAGSCTITASQVGDDDYNPAPDVARTFSIAKADQTIAFAPLPDRTFGEPDFTLAATATSGLPVSYAASGNCTVSGSSVHLTASGSCTITASQAGNGNYNAAAPVSRTFAIVNSTTGGVDGKGIKPLAGGTANFHIDASGPGKSGGGLTGQFVFEGTPAPGHHGKPDTPPVHLESTNITSFGIADDGASAWFQGTSTDGRTFLVYVEDNSSKHKHSTDVFKLWIDGVPQTGDGLLQNGNVQISTGGKK